MKSRPFRVYARARGRLIFGIVNVFLDFSSCTRKTFLLYQENFPAVAGQMTDCGLTVYSQ